MTRTLFALVLFLLFLLPACSDDDGGADGPDLYTIFLEQGIFPPASYDGIIISDEEGKIVRALPMAEAGDRIELPEPVTKRFSLTLLNTIYYNEGGQLDTVFNHLTFANLRSGSYIRGPVGFLAPIETAEITLDGVQSVEDVVVRSINNQNAGWTLQGDQLKVVLNRFAGDALAVYVKANGEDEYRYFYTEAEGGNFTAAFPGLPMGVQRTSVTLPEEDYWVGKITGIDAEGVRLEVFGFRNINGEDEFEELEVWYPEAFQPTSFEVELEGLISGLHILELREELPSSWLKPSWGDISSGLRADGFAFSPDTEVDFYYGTYMISADPGNPFVRASNWRVVGEVAGEVALKLPVFSASEADLFPLWDKDLQPHFIQMKLWSSQSEISLEQRQRPYLFLDRQQGLEWKLIGLEEYKNF